MIGGRPRIRPCLLAAVVALGLQAAWLAAQEATQSPAGAIHRLDPRLDEIVPREARLEKVVDGFTWVEGPLWNRSEGALYFSEIPSNSVYRWTPGREVELFLRPSGYSGVAPFPGREPGSNGLLLDAEGRLVLLQHGDRRIVRREKDGRLTPLAERFQGQRLNSPNDAILTSGGDLLFTDPPFGLPGTFEDPGRELPFAGVFRLDRNGRLTLLTSALKAPNGLALSPDERILYVSEADHAHPVVMAYPVREDGTLGEGRVFFDASRWQRDERGIPDGMEIDEAGNLFVAGPAGLFVLAPDGTPLGIIDPGATTSNAAWGEDGSTLFITASHAIHRISLATRGKGF